MTPDELRAACRCSAGRPDWTPDNGPHADWCPVLVARRYAAAELRAAADWLDDTVPPIYRPHPTASAMRDRAEALTRG